MEKNKTRHRTGNRKRTKHGTKKNKTTNRKERNSKWEAPPLNIFIVHPADGHPDTHKENEAYQAGSTLKA